MTGFQLRCLRVMRRWEDDGRRTPRSRKEGMLDIHLTRALRLRSTPTSTLDSLEQRGYVSRTRASGFRLTRAGRRAAR